MFTKELSGLKSVDLSVKAKGKKSKMIFSKERFFIFFRNFANWWGPGEQDQPGVSYSVPELCGDLRSLKPPDLLLPATTGSQICSGSGGKPVLRGPGSILLH